MSKENISRREFFKTGFKSLKKDLLETASAIYSHEDSRPSVYKPDLIRPPGAIFEKDFLDKCTGCNECVKICPEQSIMKFIKEGSPNHLTPILQLRKSACVMCEDFPCIKVCEPRALVMPESPQNIKLGTAVINTELCYAYQGQYCDLCIKECPLKGEAIMADESCRPKVNADKCTGCGLCEHICPTTQPAITVKRQQ